MKIIYRILIFSLALLPINGSGSVLLAKSSIPQEDERNRAIEDFHEGKFDKALPIFQKLANAYPADYLLKYFTGACLVETGAVGKEAEMYLLLAITRDVPAKVFYYLGRLYHAQGNWDSALRFYNRFTNNTDATQASGLRVKDLSDLAYNQINPFRGSEIIWPQQSEIHTQSTIIDPPGAIIETESEPAAIKKDHSAEVVAPEKDPVHVPEVVQVPGPEMADTSSNEVSLVTDTTNIESADENIAVETDLAIDSLILAEPSSNPQTETPSPASDLQPSIPEIEFIHFRINPRVNYLTEDMFKIGEAREAWRQGMEKEKLLKDKLKNLQQYRNQYGASPNLTERERLAAGIIQLERETMTLHGESEMLYAKARQLELDWWSIAGNQEYENLRLATDSLQKLEEAIRRSSLTPQPVIDQQLIDELSDIPKEEPASDEEESTKDVVIYKIQLGSFTKAVPPRTKELFDKIGMIRTIETFVDEKGATVYTTGNMKTFADGLALQNQVRLEGVKDAFVIAILNEKRISLQEAKNLTGEE